MPSELPKEERTPGDAGEPSWPATTGPRAFHGLAGEVVRSLEPDTEADPRALLVHFLVMFGNAIGHGAHYLVGRTRHALSLYALFVGRTSKGRKGTAHDDTLALFRIADPAWVASRVLSGLTSGEGLVHAVRDPSAARTNGGRQIPADPGVTDKRLLVSEPEFSSVLRNANRTGNILSATLRQAWDCGDLRVMAKNSPDVATGAHVSIIGHISKEELQAELSTTDRANGLGNRFVYACVARSKYLPDGGCLDPSVADELAGRLRKAIEFAKGVGELRRDAEAGERWAQVYRKLSEGKPGLAGAMASRAEAQVLRLSCVYGLLDLSSTVRADHLEAALTLWEYLEASTRYVFGTALGHPVADEVLKALRAAPEGLTRTDIRNLFNKHAKGAELASGFDLLLELGLARCEKEKTAGRPTERWFASEEPPATDTAQGDRSDQSDRRSVSAQGSGSLRL